MPRHRPYTIKVELVRGCSERCAFCSLPYMSWVDDKWQFLSMALWRAMVDELAEWLPQGIRIECEGRGEPSFHRELPELFSYARQHYPRCQILMTTNTDTVRKYRDGYRQWIYDLLDAGLNVVLLDCYTAERFADIRARFPEAEDFFADGAHPYSYRGPSTKRLIIANFQPGSENIIRHYHNQGGTVDAEQARRAGFLIQVTREKPLQKMCVRPFREMVIWSDGALPICCNDWAPAHVIGQFPQMRLREYWDTLDAVRQPLLRRDRGAIKPCDKCTERPGFRVGLEMDWFGGAAID